NDLDPAASGRKGSGLLICCVCNCRQLESKQTLAWTLNRDCKWVGLPWRPSGCRRQTIYRHAAAGSIDGIARMAAAGVTRLTGKNPIHPGIWTSNVCEDIARPYQTNNERKQKGMLYLHRLLRKENAPVAF